MSIAGGLLWYVYRDLNIREMILKLQEVDYSWIFLSLILGVISHVARAYRWSLLLKPVGYHLKTYRTFIAVMVGYFANLLVPRMGEVTRCGIIKKTDNVSMTSSLGSVVGERLIDLITLMIIITTTIIIEFNIFKSYLAGFFQDNLALIGRNLLLIYILIGVGFIFIIAVFIFLRKHKERIKRNAFYLKVRKLMKEVVEGITSVRRVDNKLAFFISTFIIWALYYLMTYVVVFAIPETSGLSLLAGLSILTMGSLGIAAPVQGGIGTYHALVASVLIAYGISEDIGKIYAALMHTSQIVMIVFVGGISFFVSLVIRKKTSTLKAA